jgi:putative transposase
MGAMPKKVDEATLIGSVGNAFDDALMETINNLYKAEVIRTTVFYDGHYKTIAEFDYATAGSTEPWGCFSPIKYDQDHDAALNREPQPA